MMNAQRPLLHFPERGRAQSMQMYYPDTWIAKREKKTKHCMSVLISLSLKWKRFIMFKLLKKVYRVCRVCTGRSKGSRVVRCVTFRKDKQESKPSKLHLIIYTAQDKLFKRNRGFVFGTRVEIWEVLAIRASLLPVKSHQLDRSHSVLHRQSRGCFSPDCREELASAELFKYRDIRRCTIFTANVGNLFDRQPMLLGHNMKCLNILTTATSFSPSLKSYQSTLSRAGCWSWRGLYIISTGNWYAKRNH